MKQKLIPSFPRRDLDGRTHPRLRPPMKTPSQLVLTKRSKLAARIRAWGRLSYERQEAETFEEKQIIGNRQTFTGQNILQDLLSAVLKLK